MKQAFSSRVLPTVGRSIRTGLVGYGFSGQVLHAPLIRAIPGLTLAAVSSSRPPQEVQTKLGAPVEVLASHEALVRHPGLDLIVIASPNQTHYPLARAALEAGKAVVIDKPFAVTLAQAEDLCALAQRQACLLSVFHNRRWDGDFLTVQQLLASQRLGRVVEVQMQFDRFRPEVPARWQDDGLPGSGFWYAVGPHLLDQAIMLFGWPQALRAELASMRDGAVADDWFDVTLLYRFGDHAGLRVRLRSSYLAAAAGPRFVLHGTRGSYVKHGLEPQEDQLKAGMLPTWPPLAQWGVDPLAGRLATLDEDGSVREEGYPTHPGCWMLYYAQLYEALVHAGPNPVPAEQALQAMALLELACRASEERRELPVPPAPGSALGCDAAKESLQAAGENAAREGDV